MGLPDEEDDFDFKEWFTGLQKEFEEQNRILKTKVSELLMKNDDLTKITSELYRYYHRIKE